MTPEEVRAEAIDRIARFTNYHVAESAVEALGDLLPTGSAERAIVHDPEGEPEYTVIGGDYDCSDRWIEEGGRVEHQHRWTHDWQEVPE